LQKAGLKSAPPFFFCEGLKADSTKVSDMAPKRAGKGLVASKGAHSKGKNSGSSERKLEEQRKAQFVCKLCSKQAVEICPHCNIQFCNYHSIPANHNCKYMPEPVKPRNLDKELGL